MSIKIFFCYAHEDEQLLNKLKTHLRPLQRQGLIELWQDRDISAGTEWEQEISERLNEAQIILLLISPDFMNSDYCYSIEMQRALERHKRKETVAIPVILRYVHWQGEPLGNLQALPTDAIPVKSWSDQDKAFYDVAEGIRKVVEEINKRSSNKTPEPVNLIAPKLPDRQVSKDQTQTVDIEAIKKQFHEEMIHLYKESAKIGLHANQFMRMVNENGGVETAHLLLAKAPTEGFTRLWEKKRLDLSVEAVVLKPLFAPLFAEAELANARKRLADYEYKVPWDTPKK